jgi:FecR protein
MASMPGILRLARVLVPALVVGSSSAFADQTSWQIRKSSGEVWLTASGAVQQVSLSHDSSLKAGDSIRTGRNGRVLLVRGEETILIAPNTAISLPADKDKLSTTIVQQAGSILLEVEKRNVKHFQVETPYLAAVVKGTQFRVSVSAAGTDVSVIRGQVEVADFRSGQIAQVLPGQTAASPANGKPGLSLSGSGTFMPIQNGAPRAPTIERISVPKAGLSAPQNSRRAGVSAGTGANGVASRGLASASSRQQDTSVSRHARGGLRISSAIGEVRLNVHRSSNGLAHAAGSSAAQGESAASWNPRGSQGLADGGNGNQSGAVAPASSVAAAPVSNNDARSNNGNANGHGNGNGNGNANGHGNGNGAANVNNGNGNGNRNGNGNANGHGHANGHGKAHGRRS